jgi:hypothetical protein
MTAQEARSKSDDVNRTKHLLGKAGILQAISKAVEEGVYEAHVYTSIPASVKKEIEGLGYKVSSSFERNESLTTISW